MTADWYMHGRVWLAARQGWLRHYGLGLGCLMLVLALALLQVAAPHAYMFITRIPDGLAKRHPFVDLRAILQGGACWRQGVDVYRPSACLDHGVFNYSPLLLRAAWLPIGPRDTLAGGLLFCAAYAYALTQLPAPADWGAFALRAAAAFSPAAYYALEQGNLDVLIFATTVFALCLPRRHGVWAYGIFAFGAAAKFYPVALFVLALREKRRTLAWLAVAGLAAGGLSLVFFGRDLLAAVTQIPSGTPFRASFGRVDLFRGLAWLHIVPRWTAPSLSWALALAALALAARRRGCWQRALVTLSDKEGRFLVAGAVVILFCFLSAQNIEYRAIFLILVLPGLARLTLSMRWLPWLIILLLWEAVPRALLAGLAQPYLPNPYFLCFWLLREALWWWLSVEFLALTLAFVTQNAARLCYENMTQPAGTARE